MPITSYIAMAKDALIIAALCFVTWFIYHTGGDRVRIQDMKAVQKQLTANDRTVNEWKAQEQAAEVQRANDMAQINASIAANRAPLWMCRPPNSRPVSTPAANSQNGNVPTQSGSANAGAGDPPQPVDIRQAVNAFEEKYESALADCRQVIASWPH